MSYVSPPMFPVAIVLVLTVFASVAEVIFISGTVMLAYVIYFAVTELYYSELMVLSLLQVLPIYI